MKAPKMIKAGLRHVGMKVFPRQFWQYKFDAFSKQDGEPELRLVPSLCDLNKTSLDIGADAGMYSAVMSQVSRDVIAFEPRPAKAAELRAMFESVGASVRVECVALSDQESTRTMRILVNDQGRSTIEQGNPLADEDGSPQTAIQVETRRLDDYNLESVGFIKIDVEGHELAVLLGARETIRRHMPAILMEAEDRHRKNAVADITSFLEELGYMGYFLVDGRLHSIAEFRVSAHQDSSKIGSWKSGYARRGVYVNNFIFVPDAQSHRLVHLLSVPKNSSAINREKS